MSLPRYAQVAAYGAALRLTRPSASSAWYVGVPGAALDIIKYVAWMAERLTVKAL
jgi:hypothetical protein